jgi:opacity protein-like surface antigen
MKKIFFAVMITAGFTAQAQYKKANFLNKDGRTYELGGMGHFMSSPRSAQPGLFYSYGRETDKNIFYWLDLEVTLPSKLSVAETDHDGVPLTIVGKSKPGFIYRYNVGYYLVDKTGDRKILPYLTAGLSLKIGGTGVKTDQDLSNTEFNTEDFAVGVGLNGGAGVMFKISDQFQIRLAAGYNYEYYPKEDDGQFSEFPYQSYVSHPYASIGFRMKIRNKN